jgi:HK97 gp10 family phage protein
LKLVVTDNIDSVIKAIATLEAKAVGDLTRESRKAMRKTMTVYKPFFKSVTPKKTGSLRRSVKIKSKSKKGVTRISLRWEEEYAGYVNFWKESKHSKIVTSAYDSMKPKMDREFSSAISAAQKAYLKSRGFRVK